LIEKWWKIAVGSEIKTVRKRTHEQIQISWGKITDEKNTPMHPRKWIQ